MKLTENNNISFIGSNKRPTLLDEIYLENDAEKPILIFAHGFKGFKDWGHFPLVAKKIAEAGFFVIKFNFSHNGGTQQNPIDFPDLEAFSNNSYWKEFEDVNYLLTWMKNNEELKSKGADVGNINLLGHSQGGGISLIAAQQFEAIKRVATWASIANFEARLPDEEVMMKWKKEEVRYIENSRTKQQMPMNYQFVEEFRAHKSILNIEKAVKNLNKPQLIVHGADDPAVTVESAKQLKKWNPNAQLEIIEGTQHTFGGKHPWTANELPLETKKALDKTIAFLKK